MADLHHSIGIDAAPDAVRALVSSGAGFRHWWTEDVEEHADGSASLGFFRRATVYRLRLVEQTPTRVAWRCETGAEWEETHLVFGLRPEGSGVLLDFVHANWREATPYFVSCNTTWGALMFRLKGAAEGKPTRPLFLADSMAY